MRVQDLLIRQGRFLFRWRSFIPLLLLFPAIAALGHSTLLQNAYGDEAEDIAVFCSYLVSVSGLAFRAFAVGYAPPGTSGRNMQDQRADSLNTTGLYSIVKNPIYLGNCVALLGMLMSIKVWWFVLIGGLSYWIYIERVIATEEHYLSAKFGDIYNEWAGRTPIFFPKLRLWQKPATRFSFKKILRHEPHGLMIVATFFFISDFITDIIVEREPIGPWLKDDWFWVAQFGATALLFAVTRFLRKRTLVLSIPASTA